MNRKDKEIIMDYIKNNPSCFTSEIIINMDIDPSEVCDILDELESQSLIMGKVVRRRLNEKC